MLDGVFDEAHDQRQAAARRYAGQALHDDIVGAGDLIQAAIGRHHSVEGHVAYPQMHPQVGIARRQAEFGVAERIVDGEPAMAQPAEGGEQAPAQETLRDGCRRGGR